MIGCTTRTTCPYCGVGCGVQIEQGPGGTCSVSGDRDHPANAGRLCSKGQALAATLDTGDRLLSPRIEGHDVTWGAALEQVAARFQATMDTHGSDAVAFYVSGQLLTEDYYVANKFVKGWLGTANIDTNSRLCMSSSVAAHKRAFGSDTVPGLYTDLEQANLVVLVGSNLAWCHPVVFQRLAAAREARPDMRIVLIDPRRTATAELADLHLGIAPDSDIVLFGGLLRELERRGAIDHDYVDRHLHGSDATLASVDALDNATVSRATGLTRAELEAFYTLFVDTAMTTTVYSQGVNQGARGTDTVNAIINCHLVTGRVGKPGSGPFSITGQPNAMGGREVGGLADQLAAHTGLDDAAARERVQTFWRSPRIASRAGPKAVELFDRVADGRIKALWILGTNPVDSLPDADRVRQALIDCPFVVVSDVVDGSDTGAVADVLLPACAWSEKDGTVTNSERRISRQRAFRKPPGEARPDWWQIAQVAARMGWGDAFAWTGPAAIFREHAALSVAAGSADFDIGAAAELDDRVWDRMAPFQWPWCRGDEPAERRFFADGRFHHADGRARLIPLDDALIDSVGQPPGHHLSRMTASKMIADRSRDTGAARPDRFTLNTGRIRDQWHTMTRTGRVPVLGQHLGEPFVEMAPEDARQLGIGDADIVEITSPRGLVRVRALLTARQRTGSLFVPMHWSDAWASTARIDAVVAPVTDPVSGQPASKSSPVTATRWPATAFAFVLSTHRPVRLPSRRSHYWAVAPAARGWRIELARVGSVCVPDLATGARPDNGPGIAALVDTDPVETLFATCQDLLADAREPTAAQTAGRRDLSEAGAPGFGISAAEVLDYRDPVTGDRRQMHFADGRMISAIFVSSTPVEVARHWAAELLDAKTVERDERYRLLAARPSRDRPDAGAIVCSCHGVGIETLRTVIRTGRCTSVAALGECLQAGTNCGSCRPELASLIASTPVTLAAEAESRRLAIG